MPAETPAVPGSKAHKTLITAHTGALDTQANSLAGFERLLACGADCLEVDVRRGPGGLILAHDPPEDAENHPSLEDALLLLKAHGRMGINLDVKEEGLVPDAWALARAHGVADRVVLTGDVGQADRDFCLTKGVPLWLNYYLLPREQWPKAHLEALRQGFPALNLSCAALSEAMLEQAAGHLSIWTVNEEQPLRRLLKAGVMNITTMRPDLALALRDGREKTAASH